MSSQLIKWNPLPTERASDYVLTSISERSSLPHVDLRIILSHISDDTKKIDIYFKYSAFANKMTPREQDTETIPSLHREWGDAFDPEHIFFKRSDSPFLQWMNYQFYNAGVERIINFSFITSDAVIDVAAYEEIEIRLIKDSQVIDSEIICYQVL